MHIHKRNNKTSIIAVGCSVVLMLSGQLPHAYASDRGELLYENHCQSCHGKTVHTRSDSLVKSPEELRAWVMSWSIHNDLPWGQEEVADITAYLNRTFYHFTDY